MCAFAKSKRFFIFIWLIKGFFLSATGVDNLVFFDGIMDQHNMYLNILRNNWLLKNYQTWNKNQLKNAIIEVWNSIDSTVTTKLVESMYEWMHKAIITQGGPTDHKLWIMIKR